MKLYIKLAGQGKIQANCPAKEKFALGRVKMEIQWPIRREIFYECLGVWKYLQVGNL